MMQHLIRYALAAERCFKSLASSQTAHSPQLTPPPPPPPSPHPTTHPPLHQYSPPIMPQPPPPHYWRAPPLQHSPNPQQSNPMWQSGTGWSPDGRIFLLRTRLVCLPPIQPCHTPNLYDTRKYFTNLLLHIIFRCCQFRSPEHIISSTNGASLISSSKRPTTIGDLPTQVNHPRGEPVPIDHLHYLNKVYIDIMHGDCVSLGGFLICPSPSGRRNSIHLV